MADRETPEFRALLDRMGVKRPKPRTYTPTVLSPSSSPGTAARQKRAKTYSNRDASGRPTPYKGGSASREIEIESLERRKAAAKRPPVVGDPSRGVDKHGRPTHTKSGDLILKFRGK